ncbi:MAG: hypothetical protein JW751_32420, partial [Polyangiaceae bacterium]|nr:hypothetical protein [Polyangiaceae bacterium]
MRTQFQSILFRWTAVRSALAATVAAGLAAAASGCGSADESPSPSPMAAIAQRLPGDDPAHTVSAPDTVLNRYATLATNAAAGANTITVSNRANLNSAPFGDLAAGDLLLVVQMQGATISTANDSTYGTVSSLGNAGRYELVGVAGLGSGNDINLACALRNDYTVAGVVQVIRVPQVQQLTIEAGASVVAQPWNGTTGGIVALDVEDTLQLDGSIDVSGLGFRGGVVDDQTTDPPGSSAYLSTAATAGAEKGEGIAGTAVGGRYCRGAPANGGGGGNAHNAGGGGGANGRFGSVWNGQGVMLGSFATDPWRLDPGYAANGNARTTSEGGGRGGYTWLEADLDALTVGPGDATWNGDRRREVGGIGGRPVDNDPARRLFLAGGGGAGDGNNNGAGAGGDGGGLVLIRAGEVAGTGNILANGEAGVNSSSNPGDAPGGAGAGGTVVLLSEALGGITIHADGGDGGNQTNAAANEAEGPGGGGGGGYVIVGGGVVTTSVAGGSNGTTNRPVLAEFPANGATAGNSGEALTGLLRVNYCVETAAPETTIPVSPADPTNDPTAEFEFESSEAFSTFECQLNGGGWVSCSATYTTGELADGDHTLQVRAIDASGNVDASPALHTWTVDTLVPDTTIESGPDDPTNGLTGAFEFTSEAGATFECRVDSEDFAPCASPFTTAALSEGSHTFYVQATDLAGNVEPEPASYTWEVDLTGPETTITTSPPSLTSSTTGAFEFTSEAG